MFYFHFAFFNFQTVLFTVYTRKLVRLLGPCFKTGRSKENQDKRINLLSFRIERWMLRIKTDKNIDNHSIELLHPISQLSTSFQSHSHLLHLHFLGRQSNRDLQLKLYPHEILSLTEPFYLLSTHSK